MLAIQHNLKNRRLRSVPSARIFLTCGFIEATSVGFPPTLARPVIVISIVIVTTATATCNHETYERTTGIIDSNPKSPRLNRLRRDVFIRRRMRVVRRFAWNYGGGGQLGRYIYLLTLFHAGHREDITSYIDLTSGFGFGGWYSGYILI